MSEDIKEIASKYYGLEGAILDLVGDAIMAWENYKYYNDCEWKDVEKRIEKLIEVLREA